MINKRNLWFITLFSLIVVLCIYYVSIPERDAVSMVSNESSLSDVVEINESDVLIALKVEEEEKMLDEMQAAQELLIKDSSSLEQKNGAYTTIQSLNSKKSQMQKIEKMLKDKYNVESCVKINESSISIIISGKDLGIDKTNNIIKDIQSLYTEQKYITVKYQK